jgi:CheY-like chemotaxis protein
MFLASNLKIENLKDLKLKTDNTRENIKILIIDDDEEENVKNLVNDLRNYGFNIILTYDIADISMVQDYNIIICDIKGVGKNLNSQFEGAQLIKEIRRKYPDKYLIAFTAYTLDVTYNIFFKECDMVVKKDISTDEWVNKLDDIIKLLLDPIKRWQRIRLYLVNKEISTEIIYKIEKAYIKSIQKHNNRYLDRFLTYKNIPEIVNNIIQLLIPFVNVILKLIVK